MTRFLLTVVVACVVGGAGANPVVAKGVGGRPSPGFRAPHMPPRTPHVPSKIHVPLHKTPHVPHAVPHKGGSSTRPPIRHYLPGGYRGWTHACWYGRYHCRCYWHPHNRLWYYWYAPQGCFLPISYLPDYPPSSDSGPTALINPSNSNDVPAPPPGATLLPGVPGETMN
jgi:hypothetical protein